MSDSSEPAASEGDEPLEEQTTTTVTARPAWSKYAVAIVCGCGVFIYMVAVPAASMVADWIWPKKPSSGPLTDLTVAEMIRLHTVSAVVMLLFLAAGASIGSFLNVVIFRLPRRRALFLPPSACPSCGTRVKGKDNLPIIAWLRLGGRCRTCQVPLSVRYPLIEALVAIIFVVFYFRELLSGGANLPIRSPNAYNGIVWILLYTKWDLVSLYFFHMILLVVLLAIGMINYDRFRVPVRAALIALAVTVALASCLPHLNPMVLSWKGSTGAAPASLVVSVVGCLVGALAGLAWSPLAKRSAIPTPQAPDSTDESLSPQAEPPTTVATELLDRSTALPEATDQHETPRSPTDPYAPPPESSAANLANEDHRWKAEVLEDTNTPSNTELYGASSREPSRRSDVVLSLALVGAAMGVEAALMVALVSLLTFGLERIIRAGLSKPNFWPATLHIFAVAILLLTCWSSAQRGLSILITNTIGG